MKEIKITIWFTFVCLGLNYSAFSQKTKDVDYSKINIFDPSIVQAYVVTENKYIRIYDDNYSCTKKVIDSIITPPKNAVNRIIVSCSKVKNGMVQIKEVYVGPVPEIYPLNYDSLNILLANKWVDLNLLRVNIQGDSVKVYKEPTSSSEVLMNINSRQVAIVDVQGKWVKIIIDNIKSKYVGWVQKENQCHVTWTMCNWER